MANDRLRLVPTLRVALAVLVIATPASARVSMAFNQTAFHPGEIVEVTVGCRTVGRPSPPTSTSAFSCPTGGPRSPMSSAPRLWRRDSSSWDARRSRYDARRAVGNVELVAELCSRRLAETQADQ
jgi:hypothetical protein